MLIDTHSHIYLEQFKEDLKTVISSAKSEGVEKILLPNIDSSTLDAMLQLCTSMPTTCYPMSGLHPCSVKSGSYIEELNQVHTELIKGHYIAVGEIGIDLHWDKTTLDIQKEAFRKQIQWSIDFNLPFVIHARESFQEIFDIMDEFDASSIFGVFHCFNGDLEVLNHILMAYPRFLFGLGGVSTFKNAGLDKVVPHIPLNKIVLETDAPYLAPVPMRGKRNEPSFLRYIAQRVADYKEMSLERLSEETTKNALALFKLN